MTQAEFRHRYITDNAHAAIVVTVNRLPTGAAWYSYQWEGSKRKPVIISCHMGSQIGLLPWPLKQISVRSAFGEVEYVRTDVDFGLTAVAWWIHRNIGYWLRWVNVRLIVTCAVWGLAEYSDFSQPSWSDLKIAKRIKGRQ